MERLGLLAVLDRAALSCYCQCWADFRAYSKIIEEEGAVIEGHRGILRKHPLLPSLYRSADAVRVWAGEFGMTPNSRSRMSVGKMDDDEEPSWLD